MRPIERINITLAVADFRPARSLDSPGYLQCQFIERLFAFIVCNLPFAHQPDPRAVCRHVIEPMIMHAYMRLMRRHELPCLAAAKLQEFFLTRRLELQQRRPELKTLRPFCPSSRRVSSLDGEHRRALRRLP